ncbi:MAG TPA: glycosyltransferase family 1 protein [Candidatus Omnitrophota bacterium]|nr:glycosyltransferase family 1 protein [Candidatus Omnitrophota bacterium]
MQGAQSPASCTRGVGRHSLGLVKAFLGAAKGRHDVFLVLNGVFQDSIDDLRAEFSELLPRQNIKCWQQYLSPVSGISGDFFSRKASELVREWFIGQLDPDIVWSTNLQEGWLDEAVSSVKKIDNGALYCTTLHDVIPLIFPKEYLAGDIKYWYQEKLNFSKKSDILLTVSQYSKAKIVEYLHFEKDRIFVVPNACDKSVFNHAGVSGFDRCDLKSIAAGRYILYSGGADKHKNLQRLITAYSLLAHDVREKYRIVFIGESVKRCSPQMLEHAAAVGLRPDRLIFLGYVSDADLAELKRNCALFVFPSYSEGFGLPPLEAMACGCPVITSNAGSLPEVVGLGEALFDPYDERDMASKMFLGLTDDGYRNRLIENGAARAKLFSWESSAEAVLDIFEREVGSKLKRPRSGPESLANDLDLNFRFLARTIAAIPGFDESKLPAVAQALADSTLPHDGNRNLYIDISCLIHFDHATGIQRVVRAITNEFRNAGLPGIRASTVCSFVGQKKFYRAEQVNGKYHIPEEPQLPGYEVDFCDGDVLLFLDLHPGSAISKKEEVRRLRNLGVRIYFVVYDLLPVSHPQFFPPDMVDEFNQWLRVVICSDGAVCISLDVAEKLKKWVSYNAALAAKSFKVDYFHLGADLLSSVPSKGLPFNAQKLLSSFKNKAVFLMVGTIEPRKGYEQVLSAFERVWREGLEVSLVIVGKQGWLVESVVEKFRNHPEIHKRFFWLEGISDTYLEKVYATSTCLIAASEGEGFGLPLIEAAQHQLPIIARDLPVFREVAGAHAYYFSGKEPQDLADAVVRWLSLYRSGNHPRSGNMPRLTWKESARTLAEKILGR